MDRLMVFDTSLVSENMGDRIIMDYCAKELRTLFPHVFSASVPTHDVIGERAHKYAKLSEYQIVCGTNLLNCNMNKRRQWRITLKDSLYIKNICLLGVGWWQYQSQPVNAYTKIILKRLLSSKYIHSVRDEYTKRKLAEIGINNVINTACPTMWGLTEEHCLSIPTMKKDSVIFTLTDYMRDEENDRIMVDILKKHYAKVYMWIQAFDDYEYAMSLGNMEQVIFISPALSEYDRILQTGKVDYVGTRLHAGIRALNHKVRSIIIGVDNRAIEIGKDTNLVVLDRKNVSTKLENLIIGDWQTMINLPIENISIWRGQFANERK